MSWRNTSDCRLSPPSHFFFVQKWKKLCWQKIRLRMTWQNMSDLFSVPPGKFFNCFQTFRQSYLLRFFKICDKCDIACDKCDIACDIACNKCDIACNKFNIKKTYKKKIFICANTEIDVTNATNCSAGKGAISPPPHQTPGNRGSIMLYYPCLPHKCVILIFFHTPQSESPNSIQLNRLRRPPRHISSGERN